VTGATQDAARIDLRLVPAALAAWAVTAAGILWGALPATLAAMVSVASTAAVARWLRRGSRDAEPVWPGVVAVGAVGIAFAVSVGMRVHDAERHPITARLGSTATVVVTASESPRVTAGARVVFRGTLDVLDGAPSSGRVVVFAPVVGFGELTAGRPVTFRARVGTPTRPDLSVAVLTATGEPRLGDAPRWQRAAASVRADFAEQARAVLPADEAAMVPALVLGDTSALDAATLREFRTAGLTHLTAVSGANVTIVCGAVLLVAVLVGPRVAAAAAAIALVGFVAVVQPTASVLRAAIMGGIALLAVVSHRRRQAVPALAATVLVSLIVAPQLAVDIGFVLSVAATAALVVIAPGWTQRLVDRGWPRPLAAAVAIALAAQLVTAPVVAGISGAVSLVAIAANLVVAPVIPPITVIGTAAAALTQLWPAAGRFLIRFTGPELWWLLHTAQWAAAVPGASVPVPSGPAGVALVAAVTIAGVVLWRWRTGRIAVLLALLCVLAWAAGHGGAVGPP
jgi:competence protein ComEC